MPGWPGWVLVAILVMVFLDLLIDAGFIKVG